MNPHEYEYLDLLRDTLEYGEKRSDRTGVGTRSLFGAGMSFELQASFPLFTTKKLHWKSIVRELLWIMSGSTNNNDLEKHGVSIWREWADETGDLGPVYGKQWRSWPGPGGETIDQLKRLCLDLVTDPYSRRHVISAWNVAELPQMALAPCHALFQFYVSAETNQLSCQLYQRSADLFLGVPFNVASYSLLTCILADKLGFERGTFHWVGGDCHVYENHLEQVALQLQRKPSDPPFIEKMARGDPLATTYDEIVLRDYHPHPAIPAPVAV